MEEEFFRWFPYLKPVHINDLYERLLDASNGTMFICYNNRRDLYELHSLKSFALNGESSNVVLEDDMLSGWLITDYLANNINKFGTDVSSERELTEHILDAHEDDGLSLLNLRALKTVEAMVGREI